MAVPDVPDAECTDNAMPLAEPGEGKVHHEVPRSESKQIRTAFVSE